MGMEERLQDGLREDVLCYGLIVALLIRPAGPFYVVEETVMILRRTAYLLVPALLALSAADPAVADLADPPLGTRLDLSQLLGATAAPRFGASVAVSADGLTALVGSPFTPCAEREEVCGSAAVFRRTTAGWILEAQLAPAVPLTRYSDFFGQAVALSADGGVALIGAGRIPGCADDEACAGAYVFRRSGAGWVEEALLAGMDLGLAVALSADGKTAAASGVFQEPAVVFRESGGVWSEVARLGTERGYYLALALSADGTRLLRGADGDCAAGIECGRVEVFDESGGVWSQTAEIRAPLPTGRAFFGTALALSADGRLALIGAYQGLGPGGPSGTDYGTAELFAESGGTWTLLAGLGSAEPNRGFGTSVALSGDGATALVGTQDECGRALLFTRSGAGAWVEAGPLATPPAAGGFGEVLALDATGRVAVIGASRGLCPDPEQIARPGQAFLYEELALVAVPTAGETALALLALALAAAGTFLLRRV
jgi:hypothetical protein